MSALTQRELRAPRGGRPISRAAATADLHAILARRLTARDRWLARMLAEHRVLTTPQVVALAFPSLRSATHRLGALYRWRVIDRFQPYRARGRAPLHYVLDTAGAAVLASEDGRPLADIGYRRDRALSIAYSPQLAHTVGVNEVFVDFIHAARHHRPARLTAWWSQARCSHHFGDIVRPDAYGAWCDATASCDFFLEYDTGTESLSVLVEKIIEYDRLAAVTGIRTPVLFVFRQPVREQTARNVLAAAIGELRDSATVPTATALASDNPAESSWLPVRHPPISTRQTLTRLAIAWRSPGQRTESPTTGNGLRVPDPMPPERQPNSPAETQ